MPLYNPGVGATVEPSESPALDGLLAAYRVVSDRGAQVAPATVAGTYYFQNSAAAPIAAGAQVASAPYLYLDPADFAVVGRTTKLRLQVGAVVNDVGPAVTITVGLYPVSATTGAVGNVAYALGTVVAGSTVAFASPAANSRTHADSGDFTPPSADQYLIGLVSSGTPAASSAVQLRAQLQVRMV